MHYCVKCCGKTWRIRGNIQCYDPPASGRRRATTAGWPLFFFRFLLALTCPLPFLEFLLKWPDFFEWFGDRNIVSQANE